MKDEQLFYFEESSIFKSDDAFLITDDDRITTQCYLRNLKYIFYWFLDNSHMI